MQSSPYFATYVHMFFEDQLICRRNLASATIQSYRDAIKLFYRHLAKHTNASISDLLVTDIDDNSITQFLGYLSKARGNTIQTQNHRLTILRGLFNFIALQDPLLGEHCRRILDVPAKRGAELPAIEYLEKEEVEAMLAAINRCSVLGRRDYAILLFMYNTGARVQETSDLRLSWISFEAPHKVEILGKGRKWRTCPLWKKTIRAMQHVIDDRPGGVQSDDRIFLNRDGKSLSRFGIRNLIAKYQQNAALQLSSLKHKKVTPHTIRHTTAMHLLQAGVEINVIRSWLGHANLATTNRYVEIDLAMKAKALESCEPRPARQRKKAWRPNCDVLAWLDTL